MAESIRKHVNRRLRWFYLCCLTGVAIFFVPRFLDAGAGASQLVKIAGLLLLALATIVMAGVTCPRCSRPIGKSFMWQRGTPEFCSGCGVRLDEKLP
jgi:hypothetical protein